MTSENSVKFINPGCIKDPTCANHENFVMSLDEKIGPSYVELGDKGVPKWLGSGDNIIRSIGSNVALVEFIGHPYRDGVQTTEIRTIVYIPSKPFANSDRKTCVDDGYKASADALVSGLQPGTVNGTSNENAIAFYVFPLPSKYKYINNPCAQSIMNQILTDKKVYDKLVALENTYLDNDAKILQSQIAAHDAARKAAIIDNLNNTKEGQELANQIAADERSLAEKQGHDLTQEEKDNLAVSDSLKSNDKAIKNIIAEDTTFKGKINSDATRDYAGLTKDKTYDDYLANMNTHEGFGNLFSNKDNKNIEMIIIIVVLCVILYYLCKQSHTTDIVDSATSPFQ